MYVCVGTSNLGSKVKCKRSPKTAPSRTSTHSATQSQSKRFPFASFKKQMNTCSRTLLIIHKKFHMEIRQTQASPLNKLEVGVSSNSHLHPTQVTCTEKATQAILILGRCLKCLKEPPSINSHIEQQEAVLTSVYRWANTSNPNPFHTTLAKFLNSLFKFSPRAFSRKVRLLWECFNRKNKETQNCMEQIPFRA